MSESDGKPFYYNDLAKAMALFRRYGVQNGYATIDGERFEKIVDGHIVETRELEDKTEE